MDSKEEYPFLMKRSSRFGRCLVAKQDIPAGSLFFQEKPLFTFNRPVLEGDKFTCYTCYKLLDKKFAIRCIRCNWGFCDRTCLLDREHRKLDCPILSRNRVKPCRESDSLLYLFRWFLLEKRDKDKWDQLMNLTSTMGAKDRKYEEYLNLESICVKKFLKESLKKNVSRGYIKEVINIFKINAFTFSFSSKKFRAVFAISSLFSHSCEPNAGTFLQGKNKDDWAFMIYSRKDIAAGEMITICYGTDIIPKGAVQRQNDILERFSFVCQCDRCLDPTESGTNYSALKCPVCVDGWMLPPSLTSRDNGFKCHLCCLTYSPAKVLAIEKAFKKELQALKKNETAHKRKHLDELICKAVTQYKLHLNHYLVIEANQHWLGSLDLKVLLESTAESASLYHKILQRAEDNVGIADAFGPVTRLVKLKYILATAMIRFNFKSRDCLSITKDIKNLDTKISILQKIVNHLGFGVQQAQTTALFEIEMGTMIWDMQKRYSVWKDLLTKCISMRRVKVNARKPWNI